MSIFTHPELTPSTSPYQPPAQRLSAGRAWLLSLLLPGVGQVYCGATTRGGAMAIVAIVSIGAAFVFPQASQIAIRLMVMFYTLAPLDAYLTAAEHNAGIDVEAPNNPRVAALLNLTTNGFGYLYAGWRQGFWPVFLLGGAARVASAQVPIVIEFYCAVIAIHAWRIATSKREETYPAAMRPDIEESSFPRGVPYAVAAILIGHYWLLVIIGQIAMLTGTAH
jgi:hypothetical protein